MGNRDSLPVTDPPKGGVNCQSVDYHRRDDSLSGSLNTMTSQGSTMKMDDVASPSTPDGRESVPLKGEDQGCIKRGDGLKIIIISTIVFAIAITIALIVQIYTGAPQVPPHGGVSCSVKECSEIGVDILKKEGSAVDAAIAMMFCVGLFNPQKSGLGGGGFMIVHKKVNDVTDILDFREVAPFQVNKEAEFITFTEGVSSIAVPGELSGMLKAYEKFSSKKVSWKDLIAPSIKFAKEGIRVTEGLAQALDLNVSLNKTSWTNFLSGGKWVTVGQTYKRPDLAQTLEYLQEKPEEFYTPNGKISKDIIKLVGSVMTADDLRMYNVTARDAITTDFKDYKILTTPAPSSGPILLEILNIFEKYVSNETTNPFIGNNSVRSIHYLVEAMKFAFGQKMHLGDPDKSLSVKADVERMINKSYAMDIFEQIDPMKPLPPSRYTHYTVENQHGTEHISVIDTNDVYVSVSTSINGIFGSKLMTEGGIIMNSHMNDFSNPKSSSGYVNNYIEGGKRPLSSMAPTIFYHKTRICGKRVAIGAIGGNRIISGIAQLILNLTLTKDKEAAEKVKDMMNTFRIHSMASSNPVVEIEDVGEISTKLALELESMGHKVEKVPTGNISSVHFVMKINEELYVMGDLRSGDNGTKY